jgi:hypothetical protein
MHFEGRDEGKWKYTVQQAGTYGVCFNNEMARFTVKTVSFDWKTTKAGQEATTSGVSYFSTVYMRHLIRQSE